MDEVSLADRGGQFRNLVEQSLHKSVKRSPLSVFRVCQIAWFRQSDRIVQRHGQPLVLPENSLPG